MAIDLNEPPNEEEIDEHLNAAGAYPAVEGCFHGVQEGVHVHVGNMQPGDPAHGEEHINPDDLDDAIHEYSVFSPAIHIEYDEDEFPTEDENANGIGSTRLKDVKNIERQAIYEALLERCKCPKSPTKFGTLPKGSTKFGVSPHTVQCIWHRAKQCRRLRQAVDVSSRKKKNSGRKKVTVDLSRVASIALEKKGTIRAVAKGIGVSKSTLHRLFKEGKLRRHSNSIKPYLKEQNKSVCPWPWHRSPESLSRWLRRDQNFSSGGDKGLRSFIMAEKELTLI